MRCATGGCVLNWERVQPTASSRVDVGARDFEPDVLGAVRIRSRDGASSWHYLADDE